MLGMAFTRDAVLLRWNGGATERAFQARQREYLGETTIKEATYQRSLVDNAMLRTYAPSTPRELIAVFIVEDSPSGNNGDGVAWGSVAELEAAHAATDLQCKAFGDSSYWDAEWIGNWQPPVDFDPFRNLVSVNVHLEGRS